MFIYLFIFNGRKLRCRVQDLGELDFCCSEIKYFLSTPIVLTCLYILLQSNKNCLSTDQCSGGTTLVGINVLMVGEKSENINTRMWWNRCLSRYMDLAVLTPQM